MDFTTLPSLSGEALTAALALDFEALDNEAITAALTERNAHAATLFALTEPSIAEVNVAEALIASIRDIEAEQATRAAAVAEAAARFAAARESFTAGTAEAEVDETDTDTDEAEADEDETEEESEEDESADTDEAEAESDESEADVTTASGVNHTTSQRVKASAARKVGRKTKRPAVASKPPVTITAAADVQGFAAGQSLDGMEQVTKALMNRVKGFAPHNKRAAQALRSQGVEESLNQFGVASFGMDFPDTLTASVNSANADYRTVQAAINARYGNDPEVMTAAGWCAPSETVYSFIADYVVDGLITVPEVNAPRGGLLLTTGPARSSQGSALDDFGFTQTEAQAEAGQVKTCETIECPDFVDHRLDAIGYCYKIPLLTQKAYPEVITDALRFANVLYAHKVNRRIISDLETLSTPVAYSGYGASFTDSLEALSILATRERRKWNIGENAVMEVKAPLIAREVYRADMSRRTGLALTDVATDQKIAAEFAARRLNVEYVADWQEMASSGALILQGSFKVMVYPAGTFVKAVEDVVNLSAVYDAASLSVNEYTGVFFEQGILTAKAGYGSNILTIPINTAGETGAAIMTALGDSTAAGSF
jgi:hypothetical protein